MKFTDTNITDLVGAKIPVENTATEKGYVTINQINAGDGGVTDLRIGEISSQWAYLANVNAIQTVGYITFNDLSLNYTLWAALPPAVTQFLIDANYPFGFSDLPLPVDTTLISYTVYANSYTLGSSSLDNLFITIDKIVINLIATA